MVLAEFSLEAAATIAPEGHPLILGGMSGQWRCSDEDCHCGKAGFEE
ncbi:hypothetical protein [Sphingobium sp. PAMC28499]|nr:hypothetical protein [Sphingobium sp. PAMC28499]